MGRKSFSPMARSIRKESQILEFLSVKDAIKILGAHLSYNADKNNDANFFSKIRIVKWKLNWTSGKRVTLHFLANRF